MITVSYWRAESETTEVKARLCIQWDMKRVVHDKLLKPGGRNANETSSAVYVHELKYNTETMLVLSLNS